MSKNKLDVIFNQFLVDVLIVCTLNIFSKFYPLISIAEFGCIVLTCITGIRIFILYFNINRKFSVTTFYCPSYLGKYCVESCNDNRCDNCNLYKACEDCSYNSTCTKEIKDVYMNKYLEEKFNNTKYKIWSIILLHP